jgi:uncharacterized protein (DUF427 family)
MSAMWTWCGQCRPPFADPVAPGQESVWDYPRPPRLQADPRRVVVCDGERVVADSRAALRLLETASPPTFYLPAADLDRECLLPDDDARSTCEWKGAARYFTLRADARRGVVAWEYPQPAPAYAGLAAHAAFYPGRIACFVDGERVRPQPGGFYGGWITSELAGPFKGEPGTGHW